ncbi:MAG: 2-oxo-4-hydroxy-4-carboxy-5-ureidoimidazoline decarboxylase [Sandaracinaceae bacterium]|nr:2-oxo-4-hydroxy-4-carboxy-5-ureidoimidazoline decarboxylase [Sandaracinaceae bacterium]
MGEDEARAALARCCGASRWVEGMLARRPLGDRVVEHARAVWAQMERDDILEAFSHHPRIGASLESLRARFAATHDLSAREQAAVTDASEEVLARLRDANVAYEARYGHIFIVCASGKRADEMLALCEARMHDEPDRELAIAAAEQMKITELRLAALEEP